MTSGIGSGLPERQRNQGFQRAESMFNALCCFIDRTGIDVDPETMFTEGSPITIAYVNRGAESWVNIYVKKTDERYIWMNGLLRLVPSTRLKNKTQSTASSSTVGSPVKRVIFDYRGLIVCLLYTSAGVTSSIIVRANVRVKRSETWAEDFCDQMSEEGINYNVGGILTTVGDLVLERVASDFRQQMFNISDNVGILVEVPGFIAGICEAQDERSCYRHVVRSVIESEVKIDNELARFASQI